jgi:hypothetical protein
MLAQQWRIRVGAVLVACGLLAAVAARNLLGQEAAYRGPRSAAEMQALLAESVPAGTPLDEARRRLQAQGFTCDRNDTARREWPAGRIAPSPVPIGPGQGVVTCHRLDTDSGILLGLRAAAAWGVGLVNDGATVQRVLVDAAFDGP